MRHFAHVTHYEPVAVDVAQGVMAFDVPFRRVEAVLNRLGRSGIGEFVGPSNANARQNPARVSRGAKAIVPAEAHARLFEHPVAFLRAFLQRLGLTGARSGEISVLQAEDLDLAQGVAVLNDHKTAHLGKSRVIFHP